MTSARAPELIGLVLAGGDSRRMGGDKGELRYRGVAQARYLWELLGRHLERCLVSVNAGQRNLSTYKDLPVIVDPEPRRGPATGLLAAHAAEPGAAWLVAAVDMVHIDDALVRTLIARRQFNAAATAWRHADGTLEPLFAIWEPTALECLSGRVASGDSSPRRCLESTDVEILETARPEAFKSVNLPGERAVALRDINQRG